MSSHPGGSLSVFPEFLRLWHLKLHKISSLLKSWSPIYTVCFIMSLSRAALSPKTSTDSYYTLGNNKRSTCILRGWIWFPHTLRVWAIWMKSWLPNNHKVLNPRFNRMKNKRCHSPRSLAIFARTVFFLKLWAADQNYILVKNTVCLTRICWHLYFYYLMYSTYTLVLY